MEVVVFLAVSCVLGFLVYGRTKRAGLIFDDVLILGWLGGGWRRMVAGYRPVLVLSLAVQAWGRDARSRDMVWRAGNVVLGVVAGWVVLGLARSLGFSEVGAWAAGLVAVVHPYGVNTIANLTGRGSLLGAIFGVGAVWAVVAGWGIVAVPLLILAVLSKEDSAGYGLMAAGVALALGDAWTVGILALFGVLGAWVKRVEFGEILAGNGDRAMAEVGLPVAHGFWENAWVVVVETVVRIPEWFLGLGGSPYYGSGIRTTVVRTVLAALYLSLLIAAAIYGSIPVLMILLGPWLVYAVAPVADQLMDYRNYSMVSGFALIWGWLVGLAPNIWSIPLGATLILAFFFRARLCAGAWRSPEHMWTFALERTVGDRSRALQELGVFYKVRGSLDLAELWLRRSVEANPGLGPALNNLAWVLVDTGRIEEGARTMEVAVERCPRFLVCREELGLIYQMLGRRDEARRCFEQMWGAAGSGAAGWLRSGNRLGMLDYEEGKFEHAYARFEALRVQMPQVVEFGFNAAMTLKAMGRLEEADALGMSLNGMPVNPQEMIREESALKSYREAFVAPEDLGC